MRVGLVSDTHDFFDEKLSLLFAGVSQILHAGDVVSAGLLQRLEAIAPVRAVKGNNDLGDELEELPGARVERLEQVPVLIIHEVGAVEDPHLNVQFLLQVEDPKVVVSGHSHLGSAQVHDGRLWVNPGSAGKKRFSLARSAAILEVTAAYVEAVVFGLEADGFPELARAKLMRNG